MIRELVAKHRTCRRFFQDEKIDMETLRELVDNARLAASGGNQQPLKYILSCETQKNASIFDCLGWAAYYKDWPGPAEGERPSAYIVITGDTVISDNFFCDHGIAAQTILLGAREKGLNGCIHAGIDKEKLSQALGIPSRYEILLAVSLGKPKEIAAVEEIGPEGDFKYWRDSEGVHHVPKRRLDDIIID